MITHFCWSHFDLSKHNYIKEGPWQNECSLEQISASSPFLRWGWHLSPPVAPNTTGEDHAEEYSKFDHGGAIWNQ
jgi:hypothetical protein